MSDWTRRDLFKAGIAASAAAAGQPAANSQSQLNGNAAGGAGRERLLLDFGWRFHLGHADDPAKDFGFGSNAGSFSKSGGFVAPGDAKFDDSSWQKVDLPHDWAIELPFENARALTDHGSYPLGRNYPATSIGWYRRVFDLPAGDAGRRIALEFDGVFRNSIVVFNGHYLGTEMSGYAPFSFDVTDLATFGGRNVLVVRADATLGEGWFYEGVGIYRHVWLVKTNPVHVPQWGTFVRAEVRPGAATVKITTEVANDSDSTKACRVVSLILGPGGSAVATVTAAPISIPAWSRREFEQQVAVNGPALWSIEEPNLYGLASTVEVAGAAVDHYETPFGIRSVRFDAEKGFFLDDKPVKIKGTCCHQDHGGVGSALPDRIQYFRIEKLKEMQSNALRTSHNPPAPELMDACDKLGMVVMCETRMMDSTAEGLSQLERVIRCHRNHPSIVIWSLGNEEREQGNERGAGIVAAMKRLAKRLDGSRLVTVAMNGGYGGQGVSNVVDVQGFNYNEPAIDKFHKDFPGKPMVGSETASTVSTRGIYENDKTKGYVRAYDTEKPGWAATAEFWWKFYDQRPFLAGGFAWTGFDYRGEPTPYGWPCISSHFGILDMCGFPKDNFYYYQAWWGSEPVLHLFPHWNWSGKEGQEIEVWCHTNLEQVELFLNGQSLGAQKVVKNTHLVWKVKYAPGVIEARGSTLTAKRETTGPAARIVLRPDRARIAADGEDVSMVTVEVVDAQGRVVPVADNEVSFKVSGGGKLLGVCNGDASSHESDKGDKRRAFNGLAMAIVQAGKQAGELRVEAFSPGLESASVAVACEPAKPRPAVA